MIYKVIRKIICRHNYVVACYVKETQERILYCAKCGKVKTRTKEMNLVMKEATINQRLKAAGYDYFKRKKIIADAKKRAGQC